MLLRIVERWPQGGIDLGRRSNGAGCIPPNAAVVVVGVGTPPLCRGGRCGRRSGTRPRPDGSPPTSFSLVWDLAPLPCGDLPILGQTWRIEDFDHSGNLRSVTIHFLVSLSVPDAIGQAAVAQCLKVIGEEPIFEELGGHVRASLERFRKACQVLTGPTGMMGRHSEDGGVVSFRRCPSRPQLH